MTSFKVISEERCEIGESPVWDGRTGCLLWTDIPRGIIFEWHATTGARRQWSFGEAVGSFGLCASGRLVVALVNDVVLFDHDSGARTTIATVTHGRAGMRLNDSKVGPDSAFWVGSMDASGAPDPQGTLYRVAPDGDVIGHAHDVLPCGIGGALLVDGYLSGCNRCFFRAVLGFCPRP